MKYEITHGFPKAHVDAGQSVSGCLSFLTSKRAHGVPTSASLISPRGSSVAYTFWNRKLSDRRIMRNRSSIKGAMLDT